MITKFAEIAQEEVRAMFIELFDESKDVYERIDSFKQKSTAFLKDMVMERVSTISMKMLFAHISGYAIRTSIIFTN